MADSHRPGPWVKTAVGELNWKAPKRASSTTRQPNPIQPAAARIAKREPTIEPERPVARGVRQGNEGQRRDPDEEHEDPAPGEPVPRLGRDPRRTTDLPPRQNAADDDERSGQRRQRPTTAERPSMDGHPATPSE